MQFSGKESEKITTICELYEEIKGIILFSEEIDPHGKANLQIIKELRDAFDHLMRVFIAKGKDGTTDYILSNFDKAIGHVYRAGFDALDGTALSLKELIHELLHPYTAKL